jgi:hypothetical protein
MAKKGMKRANVTHTHPRNEQEAVPEIQGKAKTGKEKANPIITGTKAPSLKVYHTVPFSDKEKENQILSEIYPAIDTDLARDNIENDMTAADLQDFSGNPLI